MNKIKEEKEKQKEVTEIKEPIIKPETPKDVIIHEEINKKKEIDITDDQFFDDFFDDGE